jgi:peptidoglycan lytic transglycosylase G
MFLRIIKTGFALACLCLFAFIVWLAASLYNPRVFTPGQVIIEVEKGMGAGAVARRLEKRGIIGSWQAFLISYRLFYHPRMIRAGEYALTSPLRAREALDILIRGKVYLHSITIPEGLTAREIAPVLAPLLEGGQDAFLASVREVEAVRLFDREAVNLEGYLFPETYSFAKGISSAEAVGAMVGQFRSTFSEGWTERANSLRMSVRQVVTLASLIEKETSIAGEMRLISSVFHNRLRIGMKLDCDPTIIYALKEKGLYNGNLTKRDMSLDSPYNTYRHPGLPPGPICNPGRAALEAALFPAEEAYLYFVSRNDGSHYFSRSFVEHQNAVRRFQKKRQASGTGPIRRIESGRRF